MQAAILKKICIGFGVAAVGGATTILSDTLIRKYLPERIVLNDIMFMLTPYLPFMSVIADGIITLSFMLIALWLSERRAIRLSEFAFAFGIMLFFRGILNFVTPIGDPSGDHTVYGFLEKKPLLGMFPSGHIAALNLEYWLIRHWKSGKYWEWLFIGFIIVEAIALWTTRGHYSIDIAGGIVLGYICVKLTNKYLK